MVQPGNPDGPGGYGAVLQYMIPKASYMNVNCPEATKKTTNNRMELMAAIVALETLNRPLPGGSVFRFQNIW